MNKVFNLFLTLFSVSLFGQFHYSQLNQISEIRFDLDYYKTVGHGTVHPRLNIPNFDTGISMEEIATTSSLKLDKKSWLGRKLFNEHLVDIKGDDFHLILNPVVNLQIGSSSDAENFTYVNTRGLSIEGRITQKFSFQTSYLESQGRFANYINDFVTARPPAAGEGNVPGQGLARPFGEGGFDYGMASGQIAFVPNKYFAFLLGQGRHFWGEGHRSMFLSDASFNYPFLKIETTFWKIKYINLWKQLYDIRPEVERNGVFAKKYVSSHFLSIDLTEKWNLNFFESIVFGDTAGSSIDAAFFNPVIFYRPVEFSTGFRGGNALLGIGSSYEIFNRTKVYGQFLLDEFILKEVFGGDGDWRNMQSWQLGVKTHQFLGWANVFGRLEYNAARPYTNAHRSAITNYGHFNQPLAHPWGANFQEVLAQAIFVKNRWEFEARFHFGIRGLDSGATNWGQDIYKSYHTHQNNKGNQIGQGVRGQYFYGMARLAWLVNPASRLKLEAGIRYRNLQTDTTQNSVFNSGNATWVFLGLRTEFFNRYYDF